MTERQGSAWPPGRGGITQWLRPRGRFLLVLVALIAAGAIAQVVAPTPPPTYVTATGTFPTLDDAEAALRSSTAYYGAANQLEHVQTLQMGPSTLRMQYWLRKRPADLVNGPMFYADLGIYGQGKGDCNVPAPDPGSGYSDWCGSESTLTGSVERELATKWPGCTITGSSLRTDYSANPSLSGTTASTRGTVSFGFKGMTTTANCTNGTTKSHNWSLQKHKTLYCSTGFYPVSGVVSDATLLSANHCQPRNDDIAWIDTPIRQCGSCAGSRNPIYPATGEKQRHEDDFTFAGRTFTRHYRSLRQFRNNRNFGIGWSHTWSDRVIGTPVTSTPYVHIDESGNYESYALLSGNRYRGENSVGRVLERINANGISFRLHLPDGEVREFDLDGYLIAIRNPDDPLNDLTITHADRSIATVTDGQGRVLRFESSANLLRRIVLPDGSAIAYDYDADRNLIRVTYPGSAVRQYHYNEPGLAGAANQRHHLTGITAEDERRYASFSYDARGRATASRVLGTPNELTTIGYPTEDSATMNTAEGGSRAYTIAPGTYRRVLAMQEGSDSVQQTYDALGRLQSRTDKRNVRTEYGYEGAYRTSILSAVGTPEERRQEFVHDPVSGRLTEQRTKDRAGTLVSRMLWSYNARLQTTLVTRIDPATGSTRQTAMTYCEAADVTAGLCPQVGLLVAVDGPAAGSADTVRYEYRMADEPTCAASPTTCPYRKGDVWRTINAAGHGVEHLRYDGAGRLLSTRDANGVVTDLEYDPRGRIVASKIRGVDDTSEADDRITRIDYAPTGAVERVLSPDGSFMQFQYDAAQRLTAVTDASGNRMVYTLNAAGERIGEEARDPSGTLRRALTRVFDALGRLERQIDADQRATVFTYDAEDNLALVTDARTRRTGHDHDPLGRLRSTLQDIDGVAALTQYQYDAMDRLTQVIDPNGRATVYAYNGFGELVGQQSPDTGQTTFVYSAAGNLQLKTDARGITAQYGHDALNRLTSITYPDSSRNVAYSYDTASEDCLDGERFAKGRLARMTDASGDTAYCHDRYGHLVRKLQRTQGRTYVLRYLHTDPRGRLPGQNTLLQNPPPGNQWIGMTYPDGSTVRIVRDAQARPKELRVTQANGTAQVLLHSAQYAPFGASTGWTYGNGRQLVRSFDLNGRPQSIRDAAAGGLDLGYRFDAVGNLESLHLATLAEPARRRYVHDGMNRLQQVREGASDSVLYAYDYDATGNRTRRTAGTMLQDYTYAIGRHWLAGVGGVPREHDAAGNTTRIGAANQGLPPGGCVGCLEENPGPGEPGHPGPGDPPPSETMGIMSTASATTTDAPTVREFEYDDANRMRAVKHDGVVAMNYLYNGKGERVYRYGNGTAVTTVYDEAGRWIGDYDGNGQPIQQAIWLDDLPVGLLVGAGAAQKLYYLQPDALGTPRVVIDPVRNLAVWRWDLAGEAFGDSAPEEDVDADGVAFVLDMRFPGQRYDAATGFNYNYFRDYDPGTGRYIQSDPIGLLGGANTYGYANEDPLVFFDFFGLAAEINWYPQRDADLHNGSNAYVSPKGTFTVATHGYSDKIAVQDEHGNPISPRQLWDLIKDRVIKGRYKRIRLLSCTAGAPKYNGRSFASDLAMISGLEVEAPHEYIGYKNGKVVMGPPIPNKWPPQLRIDPNAGFARFSRSCDTFTRQCY
jgi:RHS repeat-associated protein